jgi:hypothetical protein
MSESKPSLMTAEELREMARKAVAAIYVAATTPNAQRIVFEALREVEARTLRWAAHEPDGPWRGGKKVPINVYDGDRLVCQCQTAADASRIVKAMNRMEQNTVQAQTDIAEGDSGQTPKQKGFLNS